MAHALISADISWKVGAPSFAGFAKGGNHRTFAQSNTHPLKIAKGGAPHFEVIQAPKGWATRPVSLSVTAAVGGLSGLALTGTLRGAVLGAGAGAGLGFACLSGTLCSEAAVTGTVNVLFQYAANKYSEYYARTAQLPSPNAQKERESLVAAFASGVASVVAGNVLTEYLGFDPNNTSGLAAVQSGVNVALNDVAQGKTLSQALGEGLEAALIGYIVDVGIQGDVGPQFYSGKTAERIVNQVIGSISSTISTAISPIQKTLFQTVAPDAYRFIYGE